VGVSVAQRIGDLAGDLKCIVDGKLLLAVEPGAQGLAVDQGHDVKSNCGLEFDGSGVRGEGERKGDGAAVEEWKNVRMTEAGRRLDFPQKRSAPSAAASPDGGP
jgi:hypothetical protein